MLPNLQRVGDVIRLHRVRVRHAHGQIYCRCLARAVCIMKGSDLVEAGMHSTAVALARCRQQQIRLAQKYGTDEFDTCRSKCTMARYS